MKKGWEIKKIGDVSDIFNGGTPDTKVPKYWGGDILWITPKDMGQLESIYVDDTARKITEAGLKNSSAKILPVNSVVLSSRAPIGHLAINTKEITTNQGCRGIVPKKGLSTLYLYYFLENSVDLLNSLGTGTTFKELSATKLAEVEIPIPLLPEQQRIVSVLDEAFASIAQAKSSAERNLVNARELLESMLESFFEDPQHTPDGKELESLCELIVDCEHKTAPIQVEGYPSIRTPNIGRGYLILEGVNRVSEETYTRWTRRAIPQGGDLILAREAPAGNVAVIPDGLEVCLGQRTVLIRPNNKIFNSQYLMWLLLSGNVQKFFLQNSKGSTVVHVNMKDIRGLKINNIPPLAEQRTIVARLEALSAETKRLEEIYAAKIEALEELKKSVLGKAFEGEL